jgi:hypothetical protein
MEALDEINGSMLPNLSRLSASVDATANDVKKQILWMQTELKKVVQTHPYASEYSKEILDTISELESFKETVDPPTSFMDMNDSDEEVVVDLPKGNNRSNIVTWIKGQLNSSTQQTLEDNLPTFS